MAKPVYKVRSGNISAAVWQSEKEGKINHSFTIEKQYKSGTEYKKTEFMFLNEAANLMAVAVKLLAYDPFTTKKETEEIPGSAELPKDEEIPF
jgi:hypothetical protein